MEKTGFRDFPSDVARAGGMKVQVGLVAETLSET
jgi:hypothetical protein